MRHALAILIAVLGLGLADAQSDQTDPRLKTLFEQLKTAPTPEAAAPVEAEIWTIWAKSGDSDLDQVLEVGSRAMAIGDVGTALKIFDVVVRKAPGFAEGWNKRATLLYLVGDDPGSIADIRRVLALEPRHFGALSGLGLIYTRQDRPEDALRSFEAALAIHPFLSGARANVEALRERIRGEPT
jgi:tetratricopeptide (TPR) repeat protein